MAIKYVDTNNALEITDGIKKSIDELEYEINKMFDRLENVPTDTKEWVGAASVKYFNVVAQDRDKYLRFVKSLKDVNNEIVNDMNKVIEVTGKNKELS